MPTESVSGEALAVVARPSKESKQDAFEDELFNDASVIFKHEGGYGSDIEITKVSEDNGFVTIDGTNSAKEPFTVRVKSMPAGGYANFFGALFVFDGKAFHKLNRENVRQYKLIKRYISEPVH